MQRAPAACRPPEKFGPRWHQKILHQCAEEAPCAVASRKGAQSAKLARTTAVQSPAQAAQRAPQDEFSPDAAKATDKQNCGLPAMTTSANISAGSAPAPIRSIFRIPRR